MKFSALLFTVLFSNNVFSAVDYSYCQKQFNTMVKSNKPCKLSGGMYLCDYGGANDKNDTNYFYPFELTSDGKIVPHPELNYKHENGKEIISSKSKDTDYETVVTRNDKGEISGIYSNHVIKSIGIVSGYGEFSQVKTKEAPFARKSETSVKVEIKNGKCIPSRIDTVNSLGDESRQDVSFDANLCRNVTQFFKKNPEAASCFDKGLMEKAQRIFGDYYRGNKDIYGDVNPDMMMGSPKALKTKMKLDMNQGMYGGGYSYPGTGSIGGMGVGMGMGMPGATVSQILTPMTPSLDSVLSTQGFQGAGGFGNSPVVQAMQVMSLCQGGSWGPSNVLRDVVNDESVWAIETQDPSKTKEASTIQK